MITRDEIRSIPEINKSIERKKEQLRYLQEKATSVPSGLSDGERVQSSPNNDAGKYVDAAADLNRDIMQMELELADLQCMARIFIATLPTDTETQKLTVKVLKYRYLKCYKWEEIADLVGYAERHICRLEADTVNNLQ